MLESKRVLECERKNELERSASERRMSVRVSAKRAVKREKRGGELRIPARREHSYKEVTEATGGDPNIFSKGTAAKMNLKHKHKINIKYSERKKKIYPEHNNMKA
jgi:hypothetical protein